MKKNNVRFVFIFLVLFFLVVGSINAQTEIETFVLSPLCDMNGKLTCPDGFEVGCADDLSGVTKPQCIFYEGKYVSGCLKFIGIQKIDLNLEALMISPGSMVKIIGGGETYTLNKETVGCRKL